MTVPVEPENQKPERLKSEFRRNSEFPTNRIHRFLCKKKKNLDGRVAEKKSHQPKTNTGIYDVTEKKRKYKMEC